MNFFNNELYKFYEFMNYGNKYQIGQKVYFVSEGFLICATITGFGMYVYASAPEKPSFVYMFEKCSSVSESDLFPTFDEANKHILSKLKLEDRK